MKDLKIKQEILKCHAKLVSMGYKVIAIMLYGSQNYKLDDTDSDYDFKAIVVPTLEDIIYGKKLTSTSIELDNGLCDAKDLRSMMNCWKKQNVNFIELLFTEYKWIHSDYEELLNPLFLHNEEIAHYNEEKTLSCIRGMMKEKYYALFKPYPSQKEVVEKYGYAAKQLSHIWRLEDLCEKYIVDKSYQECLVPSEACRQTLIGMKRYENCFPDMKIVSESALRAMDNINKQCKLYKSKPVNQEIEKLMDDVTTKVIKKTLIDELKGENK